MATIEELRALLAKATPNEWSVNGYGRTICEFDYPGDDHIQITENNGASRAWPKDDAALIVAAVNALAALLNVAEAAELVYDDRAYDEAGVVCDVTHERMKALGDALANLNAGSKEPTT